MSGSLAPRLRAIVDALPLRNGMRVIEVGGAPGAAAREVAARVGPDGYVLVVDRSATGIAATRRAAAKIAAGSLGTLQVSAEDLRLPEGEEPFDLAFACRVGVLDGRHPAGFEAAVRGIRGELHPGAPIFIDTGDPLRRIDGTP